MRLLQIVSREMARYPECIGNCPIDNLKKRGQVRWQHPSVFQRLGAVILPDLFFSEARIASEILQLTRLIPQ
jgi:hypothetical protein